MILQIGDRVSFSGPRLSKNDKYRGYVGTVTGPYGKKFDYAVMVKWEQPGPLSPCVVGGYLVKIASAEPDEVESYFV